MAGTNILLRACFSNNVEKTGLRTCVRYFEYLTVFWNLIEGAFAIVVGSFNRSVALVAFGLDSGIEVFVALTVLWNLQTHKKDRERIALGLIGISYLGVAIYVSVDALVSLIRLNRPIPSLLGIAFLAATVIMMYGLAFFKRRAGIKFRSEAVRADARFSFIDGSLAAAVLVGLSLNHVAGLWWADPAAALCVAGYAVTEGLRELRQ